MVAGAFGARHQVVFHYVVTYCFFCVWPPLLFLTLAPLLFLALANPYFWGFGLHYSFWLWPRYFLWHWPSNILLALASATFLRPAGAKNSYFISFPVVWNYEGGILEEAGMMEEASWRRHHGEGIVEEAYILLQRGPVLADTVSL